jgi:hypothetical protein
MKIKIDRFCALATSPSWQAWLYHHDKDIYRDFYQRLQQSRGCNQNRDLMSDILRQVEKKGGGEALLTFLKRQYPHMLIDDTPVPTVAETQPTTKVFDHYNPAILTYPRRFILTGPELSRQVQSFIIDKLKSDYVIVDGVAYIEYLTKADAHVKDSIPIDNWAVSKWKLSH